VFRATLAEKIVSQEWRIPEYTYNIKTEMVIAGKKSPERKTYDEMVSRLAPRDRVVLDKSKTQCVESALSERFMCPVAWGSRSKPTFLRLALARSKRRSTKLKIVMQRLNYCINKVS
jgi:hypothetical protein